MSIGTNISELRRAKGLTQQQLAEKLGVSGQSVSKWENDVCAPDVGQFPLLAELFGVSIDRLYGFRLASGEEAEALVDQADECETLEENIAMLKAVCDNCSIPVIASGGAGKINEFYEVFEKTGATAALAASLFHFKELTVGEVKDYCRSKGVIVR